MRRAVLGACLLVALGCTVAPPSGGPTSGVPAAGMPATGGSATAEPERRFEVPVSAPTPVATPSPAGSPRAPYKAPLPAALTYPLSLRDVTGETPTSGVVRRAAEAWNQALGDAVFAPGGTPVYVVATTRAAYEADFDRVQVAVDAAWNGYFQAAGSAFEVRNDFRPEEPPASTLGATVRSTAMPLWDAAWTVAVFTSVDLATQEAVARHELGHVLGLDHSTARADVMYPEVIPGGPYATLSAGDVALARASVARDRAKSKLLGEAIGAINAGRAQRNAENGW